MLDIYRYGRFEEIKLADQKQSKVVCHTTLPTQIKRRKNLKLECVQLKPAGLVLVVPWSGETVGYLFPVSVALSFKKRAGGRCWTTQNTQNTTAPIERYVADAQLIPSYLLFVEFGRRCLRFRTVALLSGAVGGPLQPSTVRSN